MPEGLHTQGSIRGEIIERIVRRIRKRPILVRRIKQSDRTVILALIILIIHLPAGKFLSLVVIMRGSPIEFPVKLKGETVVPIVHVMEL